MLCLILNILTKKWLYCHLTGFLNPQFQTCTFWAQSCKWNCKAWDHWEENLENVTKVFGNVSFRIFAWTLSQKGMILNYYFLFWDRVRATKPKTLGNKPTEIINQDLGYVSQNSSQRQWAMIPSLAVSFTWLRPLSSGNISNEMWHLYFCFVFAT